MRVAVLASALYEALKRERAKADSIEARFVLDGAIERCRRTANKPERMRDEIRQVILFLLHRPHGPALEPAAGTLVHHTFVSFKVAWLHSPSGFGRVPSRAAPRMYRRAASGEPGKSNSVPRTAVSTAVIGYWRMLARAAIYPPFKEGFEFQNPFNPPRILWLTLAVFLGRSLNGSEPT